MLEAGRSVSTQSFDHSLVYIHSKWCTRITPEIVHQTHVYMHVSAPYCQQTNLNRFQFRAHFHIHLLNQAYCCQTATELPSYSISVVVVVLSHTYVKQTHIHTHTHISPRCISLNAISLYRNECESGHLHKVLLLRATKGMKSTSFNALCVFECESLFAGAQREKVHRAFYHPLQTFHLIYFYE